MKAIIVGSGAGGSTVAKELSVIGIDLSSEFEDAEKELGVNPLPDSHFGKATKRIMAAAEKLGFVVKKMPKFIGTSIDLGHKKSNRKVP